MSYTRNYSGTPIVVTEVEAEVSLDEFDEADIVKYMEDLGYTMTKTPEDSFQLHKLADAKMYHPQSFDNVFAEYIYNTIGRIIL